MWQTKISFAFILFFLCCSLSAQQFKLNPVSDHVMIISDPDGGEGQLVLSAKNGLVVFNTFWSALPAQEYKEEIINALNRDDFTYTINMVDRLDMFGGNSCYPETKIVGHQHFMEKYKGQEKKVEAEIKDLIDMWRWKENVSRERLTTHPKGSDAEIRERKWMNTCKQRADELERGFSLVLPSLYYNDRLTLDLGDQVLRLIWFGRAGYEGMSIAVLPADKLAIIPGFIIHAHHLAPHPHPTYTRLDVQRWIQVLEELLEGENAVDKLVCGMNQICSREQALTRLDYIRQLWDQVLKAESEGKDLPQIREQLSIDKSFSFVKELPIYIEDGDDWVRPQHQMHIRVFFLQHKNLASELIRSGGIAYLDQIRQSSQAGDEIYFDEASLNGLGYEFLNAGKIDESIAIFQLNVEQFPESSNVYDSLGEALMKNGNTEQAIANYQKSLELNPDNENAREMLKKMNSTNP